MGRSVRFLGLYTRDIACLGIEKKVPYTKVNRLVRFRPEHLHDFLERNTVKPNLA
jgi:hypothetical protein